MTFSVRMERTIPLALLLMAIGCSPALADDLLGLYIGAAIGHSQVRNEFAFSGDAIPISVNESATGWKLMAGIRPLSFIGAELAYIDFGSANGGFTFPAAPQQGGLNATTRSHPKAAALFAVGYLPIPLPYLDVFAKVGVAQLKSDLSATGQATCPVSLPCLPILVFPYSANGTSTHVAYGAGAQLKFTRLAIRAEYERISASSGDVDMLSLGLTFGF
jgi:opacity protein-like surface antigen